MWIVVPHYGSNLSKIDACGLWSFVSNHMDGVFSSQTGNNYVGTFIVIMRENNYSFRLEVTE